MLSHIYEQCKRIFFAQNLCVRSKSANVINVNNIYKRKITKNCYQGLSLIEFVKILQKFSNFTNFEEYTCRLNWKLRIFPANFLINNFAIPFRFVCTMKQLSRKSNQVKPTNILDCNILHHNWIMQNYSIFRYITKKIKICLLFNRPRRTIDI